MQHDVSCRFIVGVMQENSPQYLGFGRGARSKIWESARMSTHSLTRPRPSLTSDSRSRLAYLSITSSMLAKTGVTVDWRQRHRVCLSDKDTGIYRKLDLMESLSEETRGTNWKNVYSSGPASESE